MAVAAVSVPELVIFDCDGVLIDSEVIACRVDAQCLARIGVPASADDIMERYVGRSAAFMFADLESRHGVRLPADFARTLNDALAHAFETELKPMAGVKDAIASLPCRSCVASSSAPERLFRSLQIAGLLFDFDPHVFSATQVARGKPAPDLFLFAAQQMNVPPAHCLVIEDSEAGIAAARAAGMRAFGFAGGSHCGPGHADVLRTAGADFVFSDMQRLPDLL
jgi:HAD superfamily hydrolase (TIGR01509 family)